MATWLSAWLVCGLLIGMKTMKPGDGAAHWVVTTTIGPAVYVAALLFKRVKP